MDNLDDSENNAKVSDSAYSSSNSQSRRSHSSKSTHSGSHSSQSSGYGGKQSPSGSSNLVNQHADNISIEKNGKNNIQGQTELEQIQASVEFTLPGPAPLSEVKKEVLAAVPSPTTLPQAEMDIEHMDTAIEMDQCENTVANHSVHPQMQVVLSKASSPKSFSCVIAMHDGIVMYTTSSLTTVLGYPKDMWIGRSFIEFIHPLDHSTFASQITSGFAVPENANGVSAEVQPQSNSGSTMFCRIRRYKRLQSSFSVTETASSYMPLMLKLSFKNFIDEKGMIIYMVVQAMPLFSAFKTAHEMVVNPEPFFMRHVSNGVLEYIDHKSVPLLGYLPQDIVGKDILHLYHPDDLVYVRQVYETIVKAGGAPRTKPYRLMAQNGQYLKVETEWSSFVNPWSRKLEFVVGKHHVVQGPAEPDVFLPPLVNDSNEDTNKIQGLRDSILRVMDNALTEPAEFARQQMTKRCQDLASYMENLIQQPPEHHEELRLDIQEQGNSCFERDSVMLGGISPHHDNGDCKSSTTTPLSYNQINFNENLQRYFDRHQASSFDEYLHNLGDTNAAITASKLTYIPRRCLSPMAEHSGDSAELTSSGESTVAVIGESCRRSSSSRDYKAPIRLTESLLNRHNSEMEKTLVMQHREGRVSSKECRDRATNENKQNIMNHIGRCNAYFVPTPADLPVSKPQLQPHGVKRALNPLKAGSSANKHHCTAPHVFSVPNTTPAPSYPVTASAPQCLSSSDPPMHRYSSSMAPNPVSIMDPMAAVPAAPQCLSSSDPPMNRFSSSMAPNPVSIMNPMAAVPATPQCFSSSDPQMNRYSSSMAPNPVSIMNPMAAVPAAPQCLSSSDPQMNRYSSSMAPNPVSIMNPTAAVPAAPQCLSSSDPQMNRYSSSMAPNPVSIMNPMAAVPAAPQCLSSSDPQMNRYSSSMAPNPVSIMNPTAAVPAAPQWHSSSNPPMNLYSSRVTPQPVSIMNPMAAVPGLIPAYYVPPAAPTMLSYSETLTVDPNVLPHFQPQPVQYMIYGQPVLGPPVVVAPLNLQMQYPHVRPQYVAAQTSLELTTSNYELSTEPVADAMTTRVFRKNGSRIGYSDVDRTDGESSYSSFYSSFFKTEGSGEDSSSDAKKGRIGSGDSTTAGSLRKNFTRGRMMRRKRELPWMEKVCVTSNLIYNYQLITKSMEEVLLADKQKLAVLEQPPLVNEQLGQLYMEMELEGTPARLTLEEGITSSSSSGEETCEKFHKDASSKRMRKKRDCNKLWMMYEDAPLPSPGDPSEPMPSSSLA